MQTHEVSCQPGNLELLVNQIRSLPDEQLDEALYIAGRLGSSLEAIRAARASALRLAPRELQVLRLVLAGYASKAIAERLNLAGPTVDLYRSRAQIKFLARNTAHLCSLATLAGVRPAEAMK